METRSSKRGMFEPGPSESPKKKARDSQIVNSSSSYGDFYHDPEIAGSSNGGYADSEAFVSDAFHQLHVASAKPFIIEEFATIGDTQKPSETCDTLWDSLKGTEWCLDSDLALSAIQYGLDPNQLLGTHFIRNPVFLKKAFSLMINPRQATQLWETLPKSLRQCASVAFAALSNGVTFQKLPEGIKSKKCLLRGLEKGLFKWKKLPKKNKKDVDFALAAVQCDNYTLSITQAMRYVSDPVRLWKEWGCEMPEKTEAYEWSQAPKVITANTDLMTKVLSVHADTVRFLPTSLATNSTFVDRALECNINTLAFFQEVTHNAVPDLFSLDHLSTFFRSPDCLWVKLKSAIPSDRWSQCDFVFAWVTAGGPVTSHVPSAFLDDPSLFLACCKGDTLDFHKQESFRLMPGTLKSDKDFVLRLCSEANAELFFEHIDHTLKHDVDVLTKACAQSAKFLGQWSSCYKDAMSHVRTKMDNFQAFFHSVLCGTFHGTQSPLRLLHGGEHELLRKIASFLDFPLGQDMHDIIAAANNLNILDQGHPYYSSSN